MTTASARAIVVVGVGGIGAPCAWALSRAGARPWLVDPDVVDPSNLPRQVLYGASDVGRRKAAVAAERLGTDAVSDATVAAVDGTWDAALASRASVVVDATDGAPAKDLLNGLAVRARVPLVHAAAIGSEGRLLDVPPGGAPCLACLFGFVAQSPDASGDCASLGVWPCVPGLVGFLAAQVALARARRPAGESTGLRVLDLRDGRGTTLRPRADPRCPVCSPAVLAREVVAAPAGRRGDPAPARAGAVEAVLDLRGEACPMNLLRARRAVEAAPPGAVVEVLLGEDGADSVPEGLAALGHEVLSREAAGRGARVRVRPSPSRGNGCAARDAAGPSSEDAWLRRFSRQVVLPEVGEAGQRRWQGARVLVAGTGDAFLSAALFLATAGVGRLRLFDPAPVTAEDDGRFPFPPGSLGRRRDESLATTLAAHAGTDVSVQRRAIVEEVEAVDAVALAGGAPESAGVLACRAQEERRPWAAVSGDGAEGVVLRAVHDGLPAPFAPPPPRGPLALAGGALVADATLRRLLHADAPAGGLHVRADATVSESRGEAAP